MTTAEKKSNRKSRRQGRRINRKYKDTVFRKLFSDVVKLLELYNAIAGNHSLEKAVELAVSECIENDILKAFLMANRAEVMRMSIYEFNEEKFLQMVRDENYEKGYNAGCEQERVNTERERMRAEQERDKAAQERQRAEKLERELQELRKKLEKK